MPSRIARFSVIPTAVFLSCAATLLSGVHAAGRNYLYNPSFVIVQYGAGPWVLGSPAFTVDRWAAMSSGPTGTVSRGMPIGKSGARFKMRVRRDPGQCELRDDFVLSGFRLRRSIELAGRQITFSFYARAGANYSAAMSILVSRVTFGRGNDEAASGAPAGSWTNAAYDDMDHTLTETMTRFTHTVTVPISATQIGFSFLIFPTGTVAVDDFFEVEAPKVELGAAASLYEGQSDEAEFAECAMFYEDMARHAFTGYKHLRVIGVLHTRIATTRFTKSGSALFVTRPREISATPSQLAHPTAGISQWSVGGRITASVMSHGDTRRGALLQFRYIIDGKHPAFLDGYPAFIALDGGAKI